MPKCSSVLQLRLWAVWHLEHRAQLTPRLFLVENTRGFRGSTCGQWKQCWWTGHTHTQTKKELTTASAVSSACVRVGSRLGASVSREISCSEATHTHTQRGGPGGRGDSPLSQQVWAECGHSAVASVNGWQLWVLLGAFVPPLSNPNPRGRPSALSARPQPLDPLLHTYTWNRDGPDTDQRQRTTCLPRPTTQTHSFLSLYNLIEQQSTTNSGSYLCSLQATNKQTNKNNRTKEYEKHSLRVCQHDHVAVWGSALSVSRCVMCWCWHLEWDKGVTCLTAVHCLVLFLQQSCEVI